MEALHGSIIIIIIIIEREREKEKCLNSVRQTIIFQRDSVQDVTLRRTLYEVMLLVQQNQAPLIELPQHNNKNPFSVLIEMSIIKAGNSGFSLNTVLTYFPERTAGVEQKTSA